jgi:Mg-chelatase subunit ChlD
MKKLVALLILAGCGTNHYASDDPRPQPASGRTILSVEAPPEADRNFDAPPGEGTGPVNALRATPDEPLMGEANAAVQRRASGLKGGELDDNDRWEEYLRYREHVAERVARSVHGFDVTERVVLRVLDAEGRPAPGARVLVRDLAGTVLARRTTYADGRALFFPRAVGDGQDEWLVEASLGDARGRKVVARGAEAVTLRLDGERPGTRPALDVVFCLDCTGSMSDEIDRLKTTISSVSRRLSQVAGNPRIRLGLVKYRDRGDEYVVQTDPLTQDLPTFREALSRAYADGGGDYPEDVQAGLAAAVGQEPWDRSSNAARLVFLIGDAPPHLYADEPSYVETIRSAQEKGVKICTLAASGLDDAGEYVWRQLAEATLGRFIFISYGTPDGGRGTPHHTGPYLENSLDEIVVRECVREVEALTREGAPFDRDQ